MEITIHPRREAADREGAVRRGHGLALGVGLLAAHRHRDARQRDAAAVFHGAGDGGARTLRQRRCPPPAAAPGTTRETRKIGSFATVHSDKLHAELERRKRHAVAFDQPPRPRRRAAVHRGAVDALLIDEGHLRRRHIKEGMYLRHFLTVNANQQYVTEPGNRTRPFPFAAKDRAERDGLSPMGAFEGDENPVIRSGEPRP